MTVGPCCSCWLLTHFVRLLWLQEAQKLLQPVKKDARACSKELQVTGSASAPPCRPDALAKANSQQTELHEESLLRRAVRGRVQVRVELGSQPNFTLSVEIAFRLAYGIVYEST